MSGPSAQFWSGTTVSNSPGDLRFVTMIHYRWKPKMLTKVISSSYYDVGEDPFGTPIVYLSLPSSNPLPEDLVASPGHAATSSPRSMRSPKLFSSSASSSPMSPWPNNATPRPRTVFSGPQTTALRPLPPQANGFDPPRPPRIGYE